MSDPLSTVYDAVWAVLENHAGFTDLVPVGNRIKLSGTNPDPNKTQVASQDVPEVRIIPAGGACHLLRTSNGSSITKRFSIQVASGDQRVTEVTYPVQWEIYRAFSKSLSTLLELVWAGKKFVKTCKLIEVQEGITDTELMRGIKGWTTLVVCEIEMWFSTADLQGE